MTFHPARSFIALLTAVAIAGGCVSDQPTSSIPTRESISGRILWVGKRPTLRPIMMTADPNAVRANNNQPVPNENLLIGEDGGVTNVVVWISRGLKHKQLDSEPPQDHTVAIHRYMFRPRHTVMHMNDALILSDRDNRAHTFRGDFDESRLRPRGVPPADNTQRISFEEPAIGIRLACDVHAWEMGYVHVFDHPYYTITDADGRFELPYLPPGDYRISMWHEMKSVRDRLQDMDVQVHESGQTTSGINIQLGPGK